ncbi:MAG: DNA polymerase III subunit alpha [Bacteroidales bacterium]|nr:DNA polymerase III subunit alpha [Bacteroidales bacterium]
MKFTHLHVHSHYSILDGMSKVPALIEKCMKNGMTSMALTDHGNMFGIKDLMDSSNSFNSKPKKKVAECEENIAKEKAIIASDEKTEEEKAKAQERLAKLEEELPILQKKKEDFIPFKPIIGIETYCAHESYADELLEGHKKHRGWHLILLAKNKKGYQNLCKLSSIAFTEGYYYNARIDHEILEKYHEGIICSSACLGGEVPQKIMQGDLEAAEKAVLWFKNLFGEDYYLELQRHKTDKPNADTSTFERQQEVNAVLIELAKKHNIKIIATNDVHFVEEKHGEAHDRLICLSTGKDFDDPNRMHYTKQEWLKTPEEMAEMFSDLPEALENTQEIVDKVEVYSIDSGPIMPMFDIPKEFGTVEEYKKKFSEQELFDEFTRNEKGEVVLSQEKAEDKIKKLGGYEKLYRIKLEADYLAKLAWEGAHKRYGEELTDEQKERIIFELHIMKTMGFPGYFLIVQDYIRGAREELGVSVGPGRGSAAGSVVAYCLRITDLDPLKYDLLFERFLNPDRISLPDIDVDFDDEGRGKVLDWVTKKYGKEKVAHIITYGTMASKSSIADVSRVQKIDLSTVAQIKSYIPEKEFDEEQLKAVDGENYNPNAKKPKVNLRNCYKYVKELRDLLNGNDTNISSMLTYAEELEDTNRQIGIHACGVIIGADDLTNFAPICTQTDKETKESVLVTQYDGHVIESVGLIKMDFLGLKTLSIIKEAIKNIKHSKGIDVDIDAIPIDDELTYQLYSRGGTVGVFQFESPGMQKYLKELHPTVIGDLIAMNALYRPGPMDNIPSFIARKQGKEEITYDLPCMDQYLKDTYGITVYQEQVMLLSRLIADFTRGQSDTLRKAMGKKQLAKMEELYGLFIKQGVPKQCKETGWSEEKVKDTLDHIWTEWKKFASYAFNKSHAACYAWVSYQTAYLKAHYPAEYMAGLLTNSMGTPADVIKFLEETRSLGIKVLCPSINESDLSFSVNKQGDIHFGLKAIKGFGENIALNIIHEREANGEYTSVFDLAKRVLLTNKNLELLIYSGAFDCFEHPRDMYFSMTTKGVPFIETLSNFSVSSNKKTESSMGSLFGDDDIEDSYPPLPSVIKHISPLALLQKEYELIGSYLSSHPLDKYKFISKGVGKLQLADLEKLKEHENLIGKEVRFIGIASEVKQFTTKKGSGAVKFKLTDYSGTFEFAGFDDAPGAKSYNGKKENLFKYYSRGIIDKQIYFVIGDIKKSKQKPKEGEPITEPQEEQIKFHLTNVVPVNDMIKNLKKISITVDIENINAAFIKTMERWLEKKTDEAQTQLIVTIVNGNDIITMDTSKYTVTLAEDFIADFERLDATIHFE